jgi:surface polysaccharide O-acyltransferase-like enzyme
MATHPTPLPAQPVAWKNISVLRGAAMFLVVLNHATAGSGILIQSASNQPVHHRLGDVIVELLLRNLTPVCLPSFLFASGYFMFRFQRTWKSAFAAARTIAMRYFIWAIAGYAVLGVIRHELNPRQILVGLLTEGPFSAYWFLLLLVQFALLAPCLGALVRRAPRTTLAVLAFFQLLVSYLCYRDASDLPGLFGSRSVLQNCPFFLLGMLFSAYADDLMRTLQTRRKYWAIAACGLFGMTCAESVVLGHLFGDGTPGAYDYSGARISFVLFSAVMIVLVLTSPSNHSKLRARLDYLGTRSLALLLLVDPTMFTMLIGLWHSNRLLGPAHGATASAPPWVRGTWSIVPLLLTGLFAPLLVLGVVERLFGKRVKNFLFG